MSANAYVVKDGHLPSAKPTRSVLEDSKHRATLMALGATPVSLGADPAQTERPHPLEGKPSALCPPFRSTCDDWSGLPHLASKQLEHGQQIKVRLIVGCPYVFVSGSGCRSAKNAIKESRGCEFQIEKAIE